MTKSIRLRTALSATTILAAGLMLAAAPAQAQSLPDTGSVSSVTSGLSGGAPGSTNPTFSTSGAPGAETLRVDLKDNRTILNWTGNGFNIAAGNTVDFKNARATSGVSGRTDNIAVLNRDLSGGVSNVSGRITSDANIAVYLINTSGILFDNGSAVNTGSFFASTRDLTDADFFDGNGTLHFSGSSWPGITVRDGARLQASGTGTGSGEKTGDLLLLGGTIRAFDASSAQMLASGDIGLLVADDVIVQSSAGSPLAFAIQRGAEMSSTIFHVQGSITGRNVTLGLFTRGHHFPTLEAVASIVATGAVATDRGVVLVANTSGNGIASAPAAAGIIDATGNITVAGPVQALAGNVFARAPSDIGIESIVAGGMIDLGSGGDMYLDTGTAAGNITLRTGRLQARSIATTGALSDLVIDIGTLQGPPGSFQAGRDIHFYLSNLSSGATATSIVAARDVRIAGWIEAAQVRATAGSVRTVANEGGMGGVRIGTLVAGTTAHLDGGQSQLVVENATIGGDLTLITRPMTIGGNTDIVLGNATIGGSLSATSTDTIRLSGNILVPGNITVEAGRVVHIGGLTADVSEMRAAGSISIRSGLDQTFLGDIEIRGSATVQSNSDGVGGESITFDAGGGINLIAASSLIAGTIAQRTSIDLRARQGMAAFSLGSVTARNLRTSFGAGAFIDGIVRENGGVSLLGPINVIDSLLIRANRLQSLSEISVTDGNLMIEDIGVYAPDFPAPGLSINNRLAASGDVTVRLNEGTLTLGASSEITGANVTLSSGGIFRNQSGSDAINASQRWVVYASTPNGSIFNGLNSGNTAYWGSTIATRVPSSINDNRYVFAIRPTLVFSTVDFSKVYGTDLTGSSALPFAVRGYHPGVAGAFLGDTAATAYSGNPLIQSAGFAERASVAGSPYAQTIVQGSLESASGYAFAFAPSTGMVTVTPKALTGSIDANDKTYDGNTIGSGTVSLSGVLVGDTVGAAGSVFTFADKNAGAGKTVNVTGTTLTGADSGNYTLTIPASALADILQKALSATITVNGKTYDGTTAATGSVTLHGVVAGDEVDTTGTTFAFADKNAGTGKMVDVTGTTLTGANSGNYTVTVPASALADILQKSLNATITVNGKTYDGTTAATGSIALHGVIAGDAVDTTGSVFTFADKHAGTGKTANVTGTTLTGADSGNYTLTIPASALGDILKKALTATVTAGSKTYDGTTAATGSATLSGVVAGDSVGTGGITFTFADKNAGTGKTVAVGGSLSGADAGNYTISLPATVLADILKKALTATVTVKSKTYDGTTAATGSVALNGIVGGDSVGTTGSVFAFADKNAATGKTVNISGTSLTGADSGNYTLTIPATALANILKKALTATISADSKTYDGTTAATGLVALDGAVSGDNVGTTGSVFTFADKHAGTGKTVNVTGTTLTGTGSGNYTLTIPATALADILKKALTATISADSKTYDGTTAATGLVALDGAVSGDNVGTIDSVFTFADKHAGAGKTVNVTGTTLTGTDSGNYTLTIPATARADILKKALTATVTANGKTYDGTTTATGSVALNGVVSGDAVGTIGATFTFADKNAGIGRTVSVAGTRLTGADSGNYTLTVPATALADILKKALTATVSVDDRTYDGTTAATGSVTLGGVVSGDTVGTIGTAFTFADKNAGAGKTVNVTGATLTGADSGNYTLTIPATALANILRKALTANVTANGKTYDGTTAATGNVSLAGVVAGDDISTSGITFTFADKNAGTGKSVAIGGDLSGADRGNYTVGLPATVLADIVKKAITASAAVDSKTYDGTTAATGALTLNGVVAGDMVATSGTSFTFADKSAGTDKTANITGTMLTGADSGNYTLTVPASALADILKKTLTANVTVDGKTYDGTTAATGAISLNGVVSGDVVGTSGTSFTFTDKNAGTGKIVTVAGTTLTGTDSGNYALTIPASVLADIAKRALGVTADDKAKYTGDVDPALTFAITLGSLVAGDQLTGALVRTPGEAPGSYMINQGALSAGDNYAITFTPGALTISVNPATSQQQTLRSIPLPAGIQAPPAAGSGVQLGIEALCGEDTSCVVN